MRRITLALSLILATSAVGACGATTVQGARAIHSQTTGDTPTTWIYFETNDVGLNGVYRCYDNSGAPVCKKAKLVR